jgi:hypothetical protein
MSARRTRTVGSKGSAATAQRAMRQKLARDLGKVIAYVAPARASTSSQSMDFPKFVADLIAGVFNAIVDGSIQQMQAYADLLRDVASSVDAFAHDNVAAARARDRLVERYPCLAVPKRRVAGKAARQQLLATMVLMGINRIVVTDGKISAAPAPRKRSS